MFYYHNKSNSYNFCYYYNHNNKNSFKESRTKLVFVCLDQFYLMTIDVFH